jgi:hypothetical protein
MNLLIIIIIIKLLITIIKLMNRLSNIAFILNLKQPYRPVAAALKQNHPKSDRTSLKGDGQMEQQRVKTVRKAEE